MRARMEFVPIVKSPFARVQDLCVIGNLARLLAEDFFHMLDPTSDVVREVIRRKESVWATVAKSTGTNVQTLGGPAVPASWL